MKAVLLAGGFGTRISEETMLRPKPLVEIGGRPIIWHIMKLFSAHGVNDFIVCLGYRGYMIKEYFQNYVLHQSDVTIDMRSGATICHQNCAEPWSVTLVDTGPDTMTGGRIKRIGHYLNKDEPFFMTYGDGVSNVDITALAAFHESHGRQATVTAVAPPGRYGALECDGATVRRFTEKPPGDNGRINGGFFVLDPAVLNRIPNDATPFETVPLEGLAHDGELCAYHHDGFWYAMDTLRDKNHLEALWTSGKAPWRVWES